MTFFQRGNYYLTTKHTKDAKLGKGLINFSLAFVIFVAFVVRHELYLARLVSRLHPTHAALRKTQTCEHAGDPDGRADAFDDRHAQLFLQPLGFDVHRTLAGNHRVNDFGALIEEFLRFADKVGDNLIAVLRKIGQVEAADAKADNT